MIYESGLVTPIGAPSARVDFSVTHRCPSDGGLMPCCGLTPFEVPRTDRITLDPALVTCTGRPVR